MMKLVFRSARIIFLVVTSAFVLTGCAKHPKPVESAAPPSAPALTVQEMKETVVARVNGVDVRMDALVRMMNIMSASAPATASSESREALRQKALDQLVLRELVLQRAARQGLRVEERDIDHAMDNFIMSRGHEEGFQDFLEKQHTTAQEVREQVGKNLLLQQLFIKEVLQKVSVSDDEIRKEFEGHKDQYVTQDKQMPYEEAKVAIEKKLKAAALQKRIAEWERELKEDAKIEIIEAGARSQGAGE